MYSTDVVEFPSSTAGASGPFLERVLGADDLDSARAAIEAAGGVVTVSPSRASAADVSSAARARSALDVGGLP